MVPVCIAAARCVPHLPPQCSWQGAGSGRMQQCPLPLALLLQWHPEHGRAADVARRVLSTLCELSVGKAQPGRAARLPSTMEEHWQVSSSIEGPCTARLLIPGVQLAQAAYHTSATIPRSGCSAGCRWLKLRPGLAMWLPTAISGGARGMTARLSPSDTHCSCGSPAR